MFINYMFLSFFYWKERKKDLTSFEFYPKVSILKPIKNIDDGLKENIESFFNIDYPNYEIIFGLNDCGDNCFSLVGEIIKKYPKVTAKILNVSSSTQKFINPKIAVLKEIAKVADCDLYWVADSNIRVNSHTLKRLIHEYLHKGSKIIFSPIKGSGSRSFFSIIENSYLNSFVSVNIIASWKYFKKQIIVGKSMLIEKKAFEGFGGFEFFGKYLAEDYMIGKKYAQKGIKISTNFTWVTNYVSNTTFFHFYSRALRWAKLRYNIERGFYFAEILLLPLPVSLIAVLIYGESALWLFLVTLILKTVLEYINFVIINTEDSKKIKNFLLYPICMIVKDFILFAVYFVPFFSKQVEWRGTKLKIGKDTVIKN